MDLQIEIHIVIPDFRNILFLYQTQLIIYNL
jgi:hypothetical protein